jgi:hypothetical protein
MGTWEYTVIHVEGSPIDVENLGQTNRLGSEQWEAFAVTEDNTGWWVFLKRPTGALESGAARTRRRRARPNR